MTSRLILMRHGRTYANVQRFLDTRPPGAELVDDSRGQVVDAGIKLREIAPDLGLAASSVALRAQQSLHLALLGYGAYSSGMPGVGRSSVPTIVAEGIHEIFAGDFEGDDSDLAHKHYNSALAKWKAGELDASLPGGETPRQVLARAVPALKMLLSEANGKDLFVVSHGATIRILGLHGTTTDREVINNRYIANGSLAVIEPHGEFGTWQCSWWAGEEV